MHRPLVTSVPLNNCLLSRRTLLSTGKDSPVIIDSSICRLRDSIIFPSAGMRSPSLIITISPGTTSRPGTRISIPSLITKALGDESFFNTSRAF